MRICALRPRRASLADERTSSLCMSSTEVSIARSAAAHTADPMLMTANDILWLLLPA